MTATKQEKKGKPQDKKVEDVIDATAEEVTEEVTEEVSDVMGKKVDSTTPETDAEEQKETRQRKADKDTPDYATASESMRARMDELIATIDPYDLNTIVAYGKEPLEDLAQVAERIMQASREDSSFMEAMDQVQDQLGGIEFGNIGDKISALAGKGVEAAKKRPGTTVLTGAATLGALALMPLLAPAALLGIPAAQKWRETQKLKADKDGWEASQIADELRKQMSLSDEVIGSLEDAGVHIPKIIEDINDLGRARVKAYREVSIYIGAGKEMQRRMEEAIAGKDGEDLSVEESTNLEDFRMGYDMLQQRLTDIIAGRAVSLFTVATLSNLKQIFAQANLKIQGHLGTSVPQWKAQMAEAGTLLQAYKIAGAIKEADKFGDELLTKSVKMYGNTKKMINESVRRGAYDPDKVVKVLEEMQQVIKDDALKLEEHRTNLVETQKRLEEKSGDLVAQMRETAAGTRMVLDEATEDDGKPQKKLGVGKDDDGEEANVSKNASEKKAPVKPANTGPSPSP